MEHSHEDQGDVGPGTNVGWMGGWALDGRMTDRQSAQRTACSKTHAVLRLCLSAYKITAPDCQLRRVLTLPGGARCTGSRT